MKATHWLEVRVQLRNHHKLNSSAMSLGIPRVNLLGHLVGLWLGVLEFAEDGDLWRGNEEKTLRFIASLAELPFSPMKDVKPPRHDAPAARLRTMDIRRAEATMLPPERFVEVLRLDGWLDGWLIHDWLDYSGRYLYAKYKSHRRNKLAEIWAKHGRRYGEGGDGTGMRVGCERDADGLDQGCDLRLPLTLNPIPSTLNPYTLDEMKINNPKGGVGHKR